MDSKEKPFGELRITTTVGLGSNWLTPRITEFVELYPEIKVHLLLEDAELDLGMREADIAIRLRQPVQPDLVQRKLFTVHNHIYAAPDYLRRRGTPSVVEDLDDHNILTFGPRSPAYLQDINWLETIGRTDGTRREPVLRINNVYGLKRAAQQGLGISSLPDYLIGEGGAGLIRLLPDVIPPEFDTYFVYPEELRTSKRVAVFRDFILTKAREWSF
jgi:DNA-binding transcriptional LysR family regulator